MRPYALIENVVVDPEVRSKGVGYQLIKHVEQICIELHCTKIMLLSNSNRVEAHKFFERNGYNGSVSKGFKKYLKITNEEIETTMKDIINENQKSLKELAE